ncbi:MAG: hypothetical protein B6247_28310 [Candidatus Parabeggiatoa sp. nov. 2]|nr:MAG: hypothetical protein B6247_28310 [Beggiatoa sp. 4572_84]
MYYNQVRFGICKLDLAAFYCAFVIVGLKTLATALLSVNNNNSHSIGEFSVTAPQSVAACTTDTAPNWTA